MNIENPLSFYFVTRYCLCRSTYLSELIASDNQLPPFSQFLVTFPLTTSFQTPVFWLNSFPFQTSCSMPDQQYGATWTHGRRPGTVATVICDHTTSHQREVYDPRELELATSNPPSTMTRYLINSINVFSPCTVSPYQNHWATTTQ